MEEKRQVEIDTLRGELREEKEYVGALRASKADAERILSDKIDEYVAAVTERDRYREALKLAYPYVKDILAAESRPALQAIVREDLERIAAVLKEDQ